MLNRRKVIMKTIVAGIFILIQPGSAQVEITDFFSDFTSSDVT